MRTTTHRFALIAAMLLAATSSHAVTIDWVSVGNPGNAPDKRYDATGFGAVSNNYRIGKYEVTAGQYTEFLNAVAVTDTYGLYNTLMWTDVYGAKIERNGGPGTYGYSVAPAWANRPVNWVSFWDAVRFANWLHNGQPTGLQGPGTTEDGAYHDVGQQLEFGRNPGAKYFVPTEDEWYKAAYHDQSAGLSAKYFTYPTGTDTMPGNDVTETTNSGNNANYYINDERTEVGEFELSSSPYGTFDQGGNVWEWNETVLFDDYRCVRGGSYYNDPHLMLAQYRYDDYGPSGESDNLGFRVASLAVPEPSASVVCLMCLAWAAIKRRFS